MTTTPLPITNTTTPLPLINQDHRVIVYATATASALAVGALLAPWEIVRIIGVTVLTGVLYGIANDMVACRDCIEYFTLGNVWDGHNLRWRPLNTLNPNLNAIVWGAMATWHVCAIAGVFFAFSARLPFPGLATKITAFQLTPYLAIAAVITFLVSHIISRSAQYEMAKEPQPKKKGVPLEFQSRWEACNTRNSIGYGALVVGGLALSVMMIAARVGLFRM